MTIERITGIASTSLQPEPIEYPETDGQPMAETDFQRAPLTYCVEALGIHFADNPDVYVSGNLLVYYQEGNPRKSFAPDVFVVFGVPKKLRPIYKIWEEGKAPDVVIEILSHKTWKNDRRDKKQLYRRLGVKEYFLYDPIGDYLDNRLEGYWLDETGQYRQLHLAKLPDDIVSLDSHLLGVALHVDASYQLRLFDLDKRVYLPNYGEQHQAWLQADNQAREANRRAEAEREARLQADRQVEAEREARLQAEQQTKLQIARTMRQNGLSLDMIAEMTGLSMSEIEGLD